MTNLIVVSFKNEAQAFAASRKLVELESFGDITVYEKVILKKDFNGQTTALQTDTSDGLRTLSGMALGTLVGAIGGPVGVVIGMISGTLVGAIAETDYFDFSDDFTSRVSSRIQPGMVAIIAEVYEQSPDLVDNALDSLGATTVFRSNVDYVYDNYVDDQVEAFDQEIADERAKIKSAAAADKSKIQQKIAELKEKRRQRIAELKEKQKGLAAKINTSMEDSKKSRLKNRISKHQTRISELEEKLNKIEH